MSEGTPPPMKEIDQLLLNPQLPEGNGTVSKEERKELIKQQLATGELPIKPSVQTQPESPKPPETSAVPEPQAPEPTGITAEYASFATAFRLENPQATDAEINTGFQLLIKAAVDQDAQARHQRLEHRQRLKEKNENLLSENRALWQSVRDNPGGKIGEIFKQSPHEDVSFLRPQRPPEPVLVGQADATEKSA